MTLYIGHPDDSPLWREIATERARQNAKFGEQNHDGGTWLTVLAEEVGELAEAVLFMRGEQSAKALASSRDEHRAHARKEAIEIAAVAIEVVEWIDRGCPLDASDRTIANWLAQPNVRARVDTALAEAAGALDSAARAVIIQAVMDALTQRSSEPGAS